MFETTAVPEVLSHASWIWPDNCGWDPYNTYALFRKAFELPAVPASAPLFVTADQSYHLYVNGAYVCRGPARGFQAHWPYDEVDVAKFLRRGRNVVAVRAHNPGFSNFQYLNQGHAGLLVAAQWGATRIVSDRSWKCRRQSGVSKNTVPASLQLFPQEHVDARVEADDWAAPGFDDKKWSGPGHARPWNAMPWPALEPRGIPLLEERAIAAAKLVGIGEGVCAKGYRTTRDAAWTRHQEDRTHRPASGSPADLRVPATGAGRFRSYLLDFGRTVVGCLTLEVSGARGGEIVDSLHVESIDEAKLEPHLKMPAWCKMAFANRLTCRAGRSRHEFYHPFGFRFLVITVRDAKAPLRVRVGLNWVGYPLPRDGRFTTSDEGLAKIWETCAWTQQCCSLDAYVDTPWREQAQWWGDARVQAWNTFHLTDDARLFRRGIHCIASQQLPSGLTYGHAPTMAHDCILPDFTLIWMLTIWDHYWQTGSLEAFRSHREAVSRAFGYFRTRIDPKLGLISYDPRYWLFLDWTDLFKDHAPTVYNLWLVLALERMAALFRLDGDGVRARELDAWSARTRAALAKLFTPDGLLRDGVKKNGFIVPAASVHSQTLALMTGLRGGNEARMLGRVLLPHIREQMRFKAVPSSYWITYVFGVLQQRGYATDVLRYIRKYWTPMARHGTTWENYKPAPGDWSLSHAWSAHPLYHLMQTIGGVTQASPAWKDVVFRPHFAGAFGGAVIPSPQGRIESRWARSKDGRVEVTLALPKGVRARVELPGRAPQRVTNRFRATL
ncbi:MAG: alpha-L-rhamnosidase N-terminal domain-containing protein [Planctomycetota bacterium]|nr:alpha-L-rhamnosidase N-terminal domain-containing protein [Planctomycetota bacterium]